MKNKKRVLKGVIHIYPQSFPQMWICGLEMGQFLVEKWTIKLIKSFSTGFCNSAIILNFEQK